LEKRQKQGVTFKDPAEYAFGTDVFKDAETVHTHQKRRNLLEEQFARLGDGCRELLQLSWAGRSMEEVSEILKVSYGYARKKKSECMGKLTELVKSAPDFKQLQY
jgi:DNA-directed RNA polymerase specialized sigma24 family protein